jgi:hypothetical protein
MKKTIKVGQKFMKRNKTDGHNIEYTILEINQFPSLGKDLNRVVYEINDTDKIDWRLAVSEPIESFTKWFNQ